MAAGTEMLYSIATWERIPAASKLSKHCESLPYDLPIPMCLAGQAVLHSMAGGHGEELRGSHVVCAPVYKVDPTACVRAVHNGPYLKPTTI